MIPTLPTSIEWGSVPLAQALTVKPPLAHGQLLFHYIRIQISHRVRTCCQLFIHSNTSSSSQNDVRRVELYMHISHERFPQDSAPSPWFFYERRLLRNGVSEEDHPWWISTSEVVDGVAHSYDGVVPIYAYESCTVSCG